MDRRAFASLVGATLALPRVLLAQPAARVYRIAILNDGDESTRKSNWDTFRERLRELGMVEGRNVAFDVRHARGRSDLLAKFAAELVAGKPDVVVCPGTPASLAASKATASIPVVFLAAGDPTGTGLVASLARPGGNVTGVSVVTSETLEKGIELLRELIPNIQRIAYLGDSSNPAGRAAYPRMEQAARKMKLSFQMLDSTSEPAPESVFAAIRRERIQGLLVGSDGKTLAYRDKIVQFAAREKLPAVYGRHDYMDAGGLMSYEADRRLTFVRGAELVQRVLKGARPADLPVEQVNVIRLTLNLKAARAMGLAIPPAVRLRADEAID